MGDPCVQNAEFVPPCCSPSDIWLQLYTLVKIILFVRVVVGVGTPKLLTVARGGNSTLQLAPALQRCHILQPAAS